MYIIIEVGL